MVRFRQLLMLCAAGLPAVARPQVSGAQAGPLVRWTEALGFVALTGITFVSDKGIRTAMQGHDSRFRNSAARVGNAFGNPRFVIPALMLATSTGLVAGSDDLRRAGWRAFKSTALATGTTLLLKTLIGRRRPDVSPDNPYEFHPISFTFNSLPSGHTTTAFGVATSLAMESKSILPDIVLYGLATSTALARIHVDKHWASDTIVGAGIGILAARLVRRHDRPDGTSNFTIAGSLTF